jgi:hypothetical protein
VHDAGGMRAGQRRRELARRAKDLVRGRMVVGSDLFAERDAVDVLGREIQHPVDLVERVHGADAGVRQRRRRTRLAPQPLALRWIADQVRRQRLEGDRAAEPGIGGEVDTSHPTAPELAHDRIGANACAWREALLVCQQVGNFVGDRPRQEATGFRMVLDQRQHLVADLGVVGGLVRDPLHFAGALERGLEQVPHPAALFGRHSGGPLKSR